MSETQNISTNTPQSSNESPKEPLGFPEEPLDLPVSDEGGFYAAALNSTLHSRYILIGKLGYGIDTSVWLARDNSTPPDAHHAYVAIKILSTYATETLGTDLYEPEILQRIKAHSKAHPGRKHVITLLDSFSITDHHGTHLCLVLEVLGTFKSTVYQVGERMSIPIVKHVARQLLLALDFLHRECGIVHTDIKPDNILITIPKSNIGEYLQRYTSAQSKVEATPSLPGSSLPIVLSHRIVPFPYDEVQNTFTLDPDFEIQLADFGTATMVDGPHPIFVQPDALRAPEVILAMDWDTSVDIWNLGCLIFEFLTGKWLFNPKGGPNWRPEAYHLGHMPDIAGEEFDLEYFKQSPLFQFFFNTEGKLLLGIQGTKTLEQILDVYNVFEDDDGDEKRLALEFLRSMLRLKPSDRATAAELLSHPWLKC